EHRAAGPAAVDIRALVGGREDLGHGAGLLVRGAAGGRLAQHRLGQRVQVPTLPVRAEATVIALPPRLDGRAQAVDDLLPLTARRTAAAGVEQPGVERRGAAVAVVLPAGERSAAVLERDRARNGLAVHVQLGLHGRLPDPVLLEQRAV